MINEQQNLIDKFFKELELSRNVLDNISQHSESDTLISHHSRLIKNYELLLEKYIQLNEKQNSDTSVAKDYASPPVFNPSESHNQFYTVLKIVHSLISQSSPHLYEETLEISDIAAALARYLGLTGEEIDSIRLAALIHNIGLIGMRERLYYKNGVLNNTEKLMLDSHVGKSAEWAEQFGISPKIRQIILQHHENYDGSGFPESLAGENIVIGARIIRLVDDFVLLMRKRAYQTTDKKNKIFKIIRKHKGNLYDPLITEKMIELVNQEDFIFSYHADKLHYVEKEGEYIWSMPSSISFEMPLLERVTRKIQEKVAITKEMCFLVEYGIGEIVRNAIIHGNRYKQDKKVVLSLQIKKKESGGHELVIKITDEGIGMDFEAHQNFVKSRDELFQIVDLFKKISNDNCNTSHDYEQAVERLSRFRDTYYMDYNAFRRKEISELSGGLGILQVKNSFDNVIIEHIIKDHEIAGTEVTLIKSI